MRPRSSVQAAYDRLSPLYAWLSDSSERALSSEALDDLLRPAPDETVLEVGCGPGRVLVELAQRMGANGQVVGVDLARGMARRARRRVEHATGPSSVVVLQGDAAALPLAERTVDAIFLSFTLELFDDDEIGVVLAELRRVLAPRGRLCLACMADTGSTWPMGEMYRWAHQHAPQVVDCRPIDTVGWVRAAGFRVTDHRRRSMWGLAVDLVRAEAASDGASEAEAEAGTA